MEIIERCIPDFKASALGVPVGVNWLQVNHLLVLNRTSGRKDKPPGRA
jgi:hypothetical protein